MGGMKDELGRSSGLYGFINPPGEEIAHGEGHRPSRPGVPVRAEFQRLIGLFLRLGVVQIGQHVRHGQGFRLWLAVVGEQAERILQLREIQQLG